MLIVPAIDLKRGRVVRGRGGDRSSYRPVQTPLFPSASPAEVGRTMVERFGARAGYVADLDCIAGGEPDWASLNALRAAGLELWADVGLRDAQQAVNVAERRRSDSAEFLVERVIAGLETVPSAGALADMACRVGADRLIFSLDLDAGSPMTQSRAWQRLDVQQILGMAYEIGVRRFIVLDVARVGSGQGTGTESICRHLRSISPDIQIAAGGGVRGAADIERLQRSGCQAVLVATALYDGRLTESVSRQWNALDDA